MRIYVYEIARPCNKLVRIRKISRSRQVMFTVYIIYYYLVSSIYHHLLFIIIYYIDTEKRHNLYHLYSHARSCISDNEQTLSNVIVRMYLHIESTFRLPRYSPMAVVDYLSRDLRHRGLCVSGALIIYRTKRSRQVLAESRKIGSPGSNARLPARSSACI